MNYRIPLITAIIIFIALSVVNAVVLSSGRVIVGVPICEIYTDNGGTRCANIRCNGSVSSNVSCYDENNIRTTFSEQSLVFCQLPPNNCQVTEQLACNPGNKSAGYSRVCDNGPVQEFSSRQIHCPLSCTCPNPIGNSPCDRATWDTSSCTWNISRCRDVGEEECLSGFTTSGEKIKEGDTSNICSPCNPTQEELNACWQSGGIYDWSSCQCGQSPIVIDVLGNNYNLTNAANGIQFDINGDGTPEQIAWSSANSDDAWLALDRNNNGLIDNGKELFGNSTPQPAPPIGESKNGFLALAVYDKYIYGGNNDGNITNQDTVFNNLRLWQDTNHNGISEANELKTLQQLGLAKIELDYRESCRTDEHGNRFKYRAKVKDVQGAQIGRWAWDVYLVVQY